MNSKEKLIMSFGLNCALCALETAAIIMYLVRDGILCFKFYTICSNFIGLFAGLFMAISAFKALASPSNDAQCLHPGNKTLLVKYTATLCLSVTMIVTVLVLGPSEEGGFYTYLLEGGCPIVHVLAPLLAATSWIFFDDNSTVDNKSFVLVFLPTVFYAAITVPLNALNIMYGPYPFLHVHEQPVWASVMWIAVIFGGALGLSRLLLPKKEKS